MSGLPRRIVAHSGLINHVTSASGCASRRAATAGRVWITSPSELGLMMRMRARRFTDRNGKGRSVSVSERGVCLTTELETLGQEPRQSRAHDFLLRLRQVVAHPA